MVADGEASHAFLAQMVSEVLLEPVVTDDASGFCGWASLFLAKMLTELVGLGGRRSREAGRCGRRLHCEGRRALGGSASGSGGANATNGRYCSKQTASDSGDSSKHTSDAARGRIGLRTHGREDRRLEVGREPVLSLLGALLHGRETGALRVSSPRPR